MSEVNLEALYKALRAADAVQLATSHNDEVTVRLVSPVVAGEILYVRTDGDSRKALQTDANPNVAMAVGDDFCLRGVARNCGPAVEPENADARAAYTARWEDGFTEKDTFLSGKKVFFAITLTEVRQWLFPEGAVPFVAVKDLTK